MKRALDRRLTMLEAAAGIGELDIVVVERLIIAPDGEVVDHIKTKGKRKLVIATGIPQRSGQA